MDIVSLENEAASQGDTRLQERVYSTHAGAEPAVAKRLRDGGTYASNRVSILSGVSEISGIHRCHLA